MKAFFRVLYILLCYLSVSFFVMFSLVFAQGIIYDYLVHDGASWLWAIPVFLGGVIVVTLYISLMIKGDMKKIYQYIFSIIVMLPLLVILYLILQLFLN